VPRPAFAAIAEIPDFVAVDGAGLVFVTGFGPAAGAFLEILWFIDQPFELVGVALHDHQRVAQIDVMIGAEAEFAAGLELGGEHVNRTIVHHAALGMARLWPWVGVKQIEEAERAIGDAGEDFERVAVVDADVAQGRVARAAFAVAATVDMGERLGHAVDERLGADEAVIGQHVGAEGHMFAAAKADFEMQRAGVAEQVLRRDFASQGHRDAGEQRVHEVLLARAQGFALGSAIEAVDGGGVALFIRGHGGAHGKGERGGQAGKRKGPPVGAGLSSGSGGYFQAATWSSPGSRRT